MEKILKIEDDEATIDINLLARIYSYEQMKAEIEPIEKQLKEEVLEYLTSHNKVELNLLNDVVCYLKKGTTRKTFDSKKFKEEDPITYEKYVRETKVKDSVSLEFK